VNTGLTNRNFGAGTIYKQKSGAQRLVQGVEAELPIIERVKLSF
jgi:hypothetical protein